MKGLDKGDQGPTSGCCAIEEEEEEEEEGLKISSISLRQLPYHVLGTQKQWSLKSK
jgi:hypothetical protein